MIRWGISSFALFSLACGAAEPAPGRSVSYWEKVESGYEHVYLYPDEDCRLTLARSVHLDRVSVYEAGRCTADEFARAQELLQSDSWAEYEAETSVERGPIESGDPPSGDDSGDSPFIPSGSDYALGVVRIDNYVGPESMKFFNVDEAGDKEMELIEFFRGLYDKYGDDEQRSERAPARMGDGDDTLGKETGSEPSQEVDLSLVPDETDLRDGGAPELAPEVADPGASHGGSLPDCSSGTMDGTETDVDCGGPCDVCPVGKSCKADQDCATGLCQAGVCAH